MGTKEMDYSDNPYCVDLVSKKGRFRNSGTRELSETLNHSDGRLFIGVHPMARVLFDINTQADTDQSELDTFQSYAHRFVESLHAAQSNGYTVVLLTESSPSRKIYDHVKKRKYAVVEQSEDMPRNIPYENDMAQDSISWTFNMLNQFGYQPILNKVFCIPTHPFYPAPLGFDGYIHHHIRDLGRLLLNAGAQDIVVSGTRLMTYEWNQSMYSHKPSLAYLMDQISNGFRSETRVTGQESYFSEYALDQCVGQFIEGLAYVASQNTNIPLSLSIVPGATFPEALS